MVRTRKVGRRHSTEGTKPQGPRPAQDSRPSFRVLEIGALRSVVASAIASRSHHAPCRVHHNPVHSGLHMEAHARARELIDAAHAADPARAPDGRAAELVYGERVEAWVARLVPDASPALRLAARSQHLERWLTPRATFPEGKVGYLTWRRSLYVKQAARARARLARVLGMRPDALPTLAALAAPAMPAAPDSGTVKAVALRARPEVRARESALREAQRRFTAERRGLIGDMQLQGGTKQTSGFMTGQIGLAMPFPLFNRNDAARQRSRGEYAEAQALRDDMLNQIEGSVGAAWRAYVASRGAAQAASTFDARGREIARIARVAYREGHVTLTELLDAERAATDAMNTHLRWAADAWLSRLEFERALGARLDESSPLDLPLLSTLLTTGS